MKEIFKNIVSSILLMWFIFFVELMNMDYIEILGSGVSLSGSYYYQNFLIFILYTIAGFTFGTISHIILYKKKKRKFSLLNRGDEAYYVYFLKSGFISFAILLSLLLREVINQPSLFQTTLLNEDFIFYSVVNFFYSFFSPLYFTSVLVFIISIFIYKLVKMMSVEETVIRVLTYIISILILFLLIFNYGFLNAENDSNKVLLKNSMSGKYNLLMIGVQGLERKYFSQGVSDKYLFDNFRGFHDLKLRSYNFQNCYSTSTEFIPSLISSINGIHSDYSNYKYDYPFIKEKILYKEKYSNYFEKLKSDFNYNIFITGDNEYKYFKNYLDKNNFKNSQGKDKNIKYNIKFPDQTAKSNLLANIIIRHPFFISFISNTFMLTQFEELTSSKFYMDKRFFRKEVLDFIDNHSKLNKKVLIDDKFAILYLMSKKNNVRLPYPYDSMTDSKGIVDRDRNYTRYIDEELQVLIGQLKNNDLYNNTVIVLFGIPSKESSKKNNLLSSNLKIPLLISSPEYKKEKIVKRNYTNLDIYPTSFELVTGQSLRDKIDGVSLLDTVFVRRDIFISERFDDLTKRIGVSLNSSNIKDSTNSKLYNNSLIIDIDDNKNQKNLKYLNNNYDSFLSLFSKRTYIRGDYKLNIYPKSEYVEYQLFDIKTDPYERKNLAYEKKRILDRMIGRMHKKYEKRYGYSFINGYFVK